MSGRARLILWAPVLLLLAFETYLSSQSWLPDPGIRLPGLDKLEHVAYFFLTGLLAVRAARFGERWERGRIAVFLVLTSFLWGCVDEIHQSYVPRRSVELADVLADTGGVALAVLFGERLLRMVRLHRTIR